jgi:NitT/TauT family transport system substrate-binding protein
MKKILFLILGVCFSAPSFSAEKIRLGLNWKPEPEFGGFYDALINGEFKRRGLDVEIIQGGAGQPIPQMLAAKKIEYGISSADQILVSRARGADIIGIFVVYQTSPQGVMVHAESGIKNLEELFTKKQKKPVTVAMERGMPHTSFLEQKYGFSKIRVVPYTGGVGTFLNDPDFAQQCFVTSEPVAARRQHAETKSFLIADAGYNPYNTVLAISAERAQKNLDQVKRVVAAVRAGWLHYLKDPKPANLHMHELNASLDLETFAEAARIQRSLIETPKTSGTNLGKMEAARWKELSDQLVRLKVLDKPAAPESCFQNF